MAAPIQASATDASNFQNEVAFGALTSGNINFGQVDDQASRYIKLALIALAVGGALFLLVRRR